MLTINLTDVQQEPIIVTASLTAVVNKYYVNTATATYTDPTPVEGKGFIVFVRSGTATVGATAYATAGTLIFRYYTGASWASYPLVGGTPTLAQVLASGNSGNIQITSLDTFSTLNVTNGYVQSIYNDGTNGGQHQVSATQTISTWSNGVVTSLVKGDVTQTQVYHDAIVELTAPSVTKNGVEIATTADIPATGVATALFKTNVNYAHTGTVNETVLYSTADLNGNFAVNDILRILLNYNCTSNANNKTVKIYLASASQTQGVAFSAVGTTQLATYLITTNGAMKRGLVRNIQFMNSLSSQQVVSTTTNGLDNDETALSSAGTLSTLTWNYATSTHLIITGTLASAGDTINFLHFRGQIMR